MGVAVLEGQDLLFWGVAGFREYQGEELLKAVEGRLLALIQTYQPQVLAMEKPAPVRLAASPALGAVLGRIRAVAAQKGLQMRLYSPEEVRAGVCETGWIPIGKWRTGLWPLSTSGAAQQDESGVQEGGLLEADVYSGCGGLMGWQESAPTSPAFGTTGAARKSCAG